MKYLPIIILIFLVGCASSKYYTGNTLYEKVINPQSGIEEQWECREPTYKGKDCKPQDQWRKPSIWKKPS